MFAPANKLVTSAFWSGTLSGWKMTNVSTNIIHEAFDCDLVFSGTDMIFSEDNGILSLMRSVSLSPMLSLFVVEGTGRFPFLSLLRSLSLSSYFLYLSIYLLISIPTPFLSFPQLLLSSCHGKWNEKKWWKKNYIFIIVTFRYYCALRAISLQNCSLLVREYLQTYRSGLKCPPSPSTLSLNKERFHIVFLFNIFNIEYIMFLYQDKENSESQKPL